jgi:hypothetical protein
VLQPIIAKVVLRRHAGRPPQASVIGHTRITTIKDVASNVFDSTTTLEIALQTISHPQLLRRNADCCRKPVENLRQKRGAVPALRSWAEISPVESQPTAGVVEVCVRLVSTGESQPHYTCGVLRGYCWRPMSKAPQNQRVSKMATKA